jgi:hypothetical protein
LTAPVFVSAIVFMPGSRIFFPLNLAALDEGSMGIDWSRMRPKAHVREAELNRLIDLQAEAFQALPSMWSTDHIEAEIYNEEEVKRLERQYGDSSRALAELLDFPTYNDAIKPNDYPELVPCWRVYPITHNSIFPLKWRAQAHRTYLPDPLRQQLRIWKDWLAAVARGDNLPYLLDLYLYDQCMLINELHADTRAIAEGSLSSTARWATKPELVAARDRILAFQVPALHPAPLHPPANTNVTANLAEHEAYQSITQKVRDLVALTRSWDANVKQNRKIRYYEDYYMTFDEFRGQANDKWLHEFLEWAEACCSRDMGLFLDY